MNSVDYDRAAETEIRQREIAMQFRKPELEITGKCHNCDEPVSEKARFCNADCRDDYERRERAKK